MATHTPARSTGFDVSGTHRALARRLRTSAAAAARVQRGPRFPAPLAPATGTAISEGGAWRDGSRSRGCSRPPPTRRALRRALRAPKARREVEDERHHVRRSFDGETTRSRRDLVIPIAKALMAYLHAAIASSDSERVFPNGKTPRGASPRASPPCASASQTGHRRRQPADELQWLLCAWPKAEGEPAEFWLSTLPIGTSLKELVRCATPRSRLPSVPKARR